MKPIPPYWARYRDTVTFRGGTTWDMTMTGSSFVSEEEARRAARERLARFVDSGGPDGGTPSDWYYPDRRLPEQLLEEIHGEDGELIAAITRNRYGAEILNTDAVLITDVDLPTPSERRGRRAARGGGLLGRLFGRDTAPAESVPTDSAATDPSGAGQEAERIVGLIDRFARGNPDLGVRTYRTRNGFRVLITGADAAPRSDRAAGIMQDLTSDELYMRLCRVQECFRARLTPKPWRIGMPVASGTVSGTDHGTSETEIPREWLRGYEAASRDYAVCHLVSTAGPRPSPDEMRVIDRHDRATRPTSGLPLA